MQKSFTKRSGAGLMMFLMCANTYQAAAQGFGGNPQLMKDIQVLNTVSKNYNTKSVKDKGRIESVLTNFESLIGRKLSTAETAFLSVQFAAMKVLPVFEVKGNSIQVFDTEEGHKDLILSVEVVDAEKYTFKFGNKIFKLDPNKPIHENIQKVLQELEKGDGVSFWQKYNPFRVPQAHAEMAGWLKLVLIGAVALVAGIFIGKAIQKKKDKDKAGSYGGGGMVAEGTIESSVGNEEVESNSHGEASTVPPATESIPTSGEEPAMV